MNKHPETAETWNKLAELYQEKFMHLDIYDESYDYFCNAIDKQLASILDIGCGPGNISKYLLTRRPDFNIHGIDYAPNMITLAQQNIPEGEFQVMDCKNISVLENRYDGIIAGFCIPYLNKEEVEKLVADSMKLLTENGILYLSFVDGDPEQSGYKTGSTGDSVYFNYHRLTDMMQYLKKNHFNELNTFLVNYQKADGTADIHTIITARKK